MHKNGSVFCELYVKYDGDGAKQSKKFVEDTFSGSLPAFLAAFTSGRGLTAEEAGELRAMIDQAEERV